MLENVSIRKNSYAININLYIFYFLGPLGQVKVGEVIKHYYSKVFIIVDRIEDKMLIYFPEIRFY